jgi:hypothetical protein
VELKATNIESDGALIIKGKNIVDQETGIQAEVSRSYGPK